VQLQIPKLRRGSYFPSFLQPRRRSEQALLSVVQQAYVRGVWTRRVDQLVESLGLRISKSEVSRICQALDEHVEAFRTRPWRAATRTCSWTPRSRRSATVGAWSTRRW
jgi:putative transposase